MWAPLPSAAATITASIVPIDSVVVIGDTPCAGIVCWSETCPVAAREPPTESCQSIPDSGTPNAFGFMTSTCSCPVTPASPAEDTETFRTVAVGRSIECMNNEQPVTRASPSAIRMQGT